jgi:hypothetical protein
MVDGCGLDLRTVSLRCIAAWVIWSKLLAGGGKPMREEAGILQFTHVERGKPLLERGSVPWSAGRLSGAHNPTTVCGVMCYLSHTC